MDLGPLLNPLRYAARRDCANLHTLRDFEVTLARGLRAVRAQDDLPTTVRSALADVEPLIAGLDGADFAHRKERVNAMVERLETAVAEPAPPAATKKRASRVSKSSLGSQRAPAPPPQTADDEPKAERSRLTLLAQAAPAVQARRTGRRIPMAEARPDSLLSEVAGVGPKTAERFSAKGIESVQDLLFFVPRSYEDRSDFTPVGSLVAGRSATVRAVVRAAHVRPTGRGKRVFELAIADETGTVNCRFFRFASRVEAQYPRGTHVVASGPVTAWGAQRQMVHPDLERVGEDQIAPQGVLPVYGEVDAVPAKKVRRIVQGLAEACGRDVADILPDWMRSEFGLPSLAEAVAAVHLPSTDDDERLDAMRDRLVFDELLLLQLALERTRRRRDDEPGLAQSPADSVSTLATRLLPFQLTRAQQRALDEIARDLAAPRPMNRLLQGDVGSGKTAVALVAAATVCAVGRQAAILAPTEILADQHFATALKVLAPNGMTVARLTGSVTAKDRQQLLRTLAQGRVDVLVGTHALLEPDVAFADLGLAVVDEQHRFGVQQRAALREKRADAMPDLLLMTATPIPRTLALTAYGDLRVSIIDERPPGRQPTVTEVFAKHQEDQALSRISAALADGRQAYVVYPLVEASDKLELTAATDAVEQLAAYFSPHQVGLLHGRMKPDEKAAVMARFKEGTLGVLVSTTVIEVGVDVPNATVMLVQHADRFGLSQLHQLRGRVGRGAHGGHCLLVAEGAFGDGWARLQVLAETDDGFRVAERDLALRGPGQILGTRQSGLPDLVVTDLARDGRILEQAKDAAKQLVARDPDLSAAEHARLLAELDRRFGTRMKLADAG